jgi:hypothetical protein
MGIFESLFGRRAPARPARPARVEPFITVTTNSGGVPVARSCTRDELRASAAEIDAERALEPQAEPTRSFISRKVVDVDRLRILDLRSIPATKYGIAGCIHSVTQAGMFTHGGDDYLLIREPRNKHDPLAVGVYGKGRRVGYARRAKAEMLAPILDPLPYDAFLVSGTGMDAEKQMTVSIPAAAALRKFVKGLSAQ